MGAPGEKLDVPHRHIERAPGRPDLPGRARAARVRRRVCGGRDDRAEPRPARRARAGGRRPGEAVPVAGKSDFGTAENGFGGGRGHEGQDLLARCGTPVVAAKAGKVTVARWHGAAGNFAVVESEDGRNQVYMHLMRPARLSAGDRVDAGDRIGVVGQTGRASTCHLHFELWTSPGWYAGGVPVDPAPFLRELARNR